MAKSATPDKGVELAVETLTGDIASFLVDRLRDQKIAYIYMNETEQRDLIADAKKSAEYLVREAVSIIAGEGQETIAVSIKKVENNGSKIKATIESSKEDRHRYALFDAAGFAGHLIVSDPDKFSGGDVPAPDPDQPDLPDPEKPEE